MLKGATVQKVNHALHTFTYVYNYTVTFRMKEGRYKITIDDVYCKDAYPDASAEYTILKIEPFEGKYKKGKGGFASTTIPEKKAVPMMQNLKAELNSIITSYAKYLNEESISEDNW